METNSGVDAANDEESITDLQRIILEAVRRGHYYVADVLDYCGPRFDEADRGLDSAAYTLEIDNLVDEGYLRRENERLLDQLALQLTEEGRDAAPPLSELDNELLDAHGVTHDELEVLHWVIQLESQRDKLPSITVLQDEFNSERSAYQYSLLFTSLVRADLVEERGILRYRVSPTGEGRELVESYEEHL